VKTRNFGSLLVAALLAVATPVAIGHGNHQAMHGGQVKSMGETVFELVVEKDGARVYLRDEAEGTPLAAKGGKLVALVNGARSEAALVPDGSTSLLAKGVKLTSGARVSVQVVLADGQSRASANFAIP
jgi:hypothetical protein